MKVVQIPNIDIPDIPNNTPEYLSRKVPVGGFPLHLLCACIGGRGSGKSTFVLKMLKWYDKAKSFDRIVLFSTTAHKEPKMKDFLTSKTHAELTHYRGFNTTDLQNEMERMEAEIEAYRDWVRRMKIWKKFIEHDYNVDKMTFDELWVLYEMNMSPPECPTKSGQFPCFVCVFDDLIGCRVFNANLSGLGNHVLISHRHYSCSVFILSQSITNFIPKQIRTNNIGLWILFPTKCEKSMKDISEDVASKTSPEAFCRAWKFVGSKKFVPLLCDYDTSNDEERFRMGFDKYIIMDEEGENIEVQNVVKKI
jgi:hypothetical protein